MIACDKNLIRNHIAELLISTGQVSKQMTRLTTINGPVRHINKQRASTTLKRPNPPRRRHRRTGGSMNTANNVLPEEQWIQFLKRVPKWDGIA